MKILVIGANGGIGKQMVEMALHAGYEVTAVLRNPARLPITHANLTIFKGDILQPETFEKYLENSDAVISAIGVSGGLLGDKPTTLYSQGNASLLRAMHKMGVKRAFFISASALDISPLQPFFVKLVTRYVIQKLLRHMYTDLREMEKIIRESAVQWTIIRPPQLTDGPSTGLYRFRINGFLPNCLRISRADVAHFMLHHLLDPETCEGVVEVAY